MPLIICREMHFVRDGAPTHFSPVACRYLSRKFPGQWMRKCVQIAWPSCLPDVNPLWSHLKLLVYSSPVNDVETLRNRNVAGFQTIRNMLGIWDCLQVAMRLQLMPVFRKGVHIWNIYFKVI
jgi:hypothetical protein